MKLYVFGNPEVESDNNAIKTSEKLKRNFTEIEFIYVKINEDLPFIGEENVVLMDVIEGLEEVKVLSEKAFSKLLLGPRNSVHDFDLGFQLKYLNKIGKLNKVTIIGLPMLHEVNYNSVQSILRKLVAQDIQGS